MLLSTALLGLFLRSDFHSIARWCWVLRWPVCPYSLFEVTWPSCACLSCRANRVATSSHGLVDWAHGYLASLVGALVSQLCRRRFFLPRVLDLFDKSVIQVDHVGRCCSSLSLPFHQWNASLMVWSGLDPEEIQLMVASWQDQPAGWFGTVYHANWSTLWSLLPLSYLDAGKD